MAKKEINFVIKVNNKEVDLSKTSFKQFDDIIKQAKKDLLALPLNDPRYKTMVSDIKTAESAWKAAQKSASELGDEMDKGEQTTKTYTAQIKELVKANIALKDSGQEASTTYADNEKKIKALRDAQEEMSNSTQKLDDALSNIPGPIGQIGQGMQQLESVSQSAKSAFKSLGLGFKTFDQAIKTSGVGALVLLLVTLIAAVVNAAKSSKPLQQAFAAMGDAVGAIFDALKPLTDFIINVFVGAIEIAASAVNGFASLFGGVSNGVNQTTLTLEREIAKQERLFGNFSNSVEEETKKVLDSFTEYKKALLEVSKALKEKTITDKEALDQQLIIELNHSAKLKQLQDEFAAKREIDLINRQSKTDNINLLGVDNERKNQLKSIENNVKTEEFLLLNQAVSHKNRIKALKDNLNTIKGVDIEGKEDLIDALKTSIQEEEYLYNEKMSQAADILKKGDAEQKKLNRQFTREDIALINERSNQILELTTGLIKEENARNLKGAQDALVTLKESQRLEIKAVELTGVTTKELKEKQAAETKAANEKIRLAQIQYDSYLIDLEINKQNRLVTEAGIGTQEYFDARKEIIIKSFEKELLLADGNADKIETARTKQWKDLLELDKEKLQVQLDLYQKQQDGLYEGTIVYFDKQRDIENKRFELEQKTYQNNFDMLEASKIAHEKNMTVIDVAQIRTTADLIERRAATEQKFIGKHYDDLRLAEELKYQTDLKMAGDNALAKETLLKEHNQRLKDINNEQIQDYAAVATAMLDMLANVGGAIAAIYEAESQDTKKTMKEREAAFEKNKQYQKATAYLSAASGIIQILTQPSTLPSPFDWIVKIGNAAALAIMTGIQIKKIDSAKFSGGSKTSSGKNLEKGGYIDGPRHSSPQGGVPIMAEGGEAVMTRGAVTMFRPLLSMMNQAGGGTSFTKGAVGSASFDNPQTQMNQMEQPIIKTYVVESELTTIQHRTARLKDLSTL